MRQSLQTETSPPTATSAHSVGLRGPPWACPAPLPTWEALGPWLTESSVPMAGWDAATWFFFPVDLALDGLLLPGGMCTTVSSVQADSTRHRKWGASDRDLWCRLPNFQEKTLPSKLLTREKPCLGKLWSCLYSRQVFVPYTAGVPNPHYLTTVSC